MLDVSPLANRELLLSPDISVGDISPEELEGSQEVLGRKADLCSSLNIASEPPVSLGKSLPLWASMPSHVNDRLGLHL